MAYVAAVCVVAAALALNSAFSGMEDSALEIGEELGKLDDIGPGRPILLNDQPIHVGSSVHDLSLEETLDRAEALCRRGTTNLRSGIEALHGLPDTELALGDSDEDHAMGLMREERDGRGVVVCFAAEEGQPAPRGFQERVGRVLNFLKTGDLDAIGRMRYFWARETDTGLTHLVRVWTDGPFNLYAMAPVDGGDVPGSDPDDMPRPPDSTRMLSATVEGASYAVRVYNSPHTPADLVASYKKTMPELGWKLDVQHGATLVYTRRDITVFITPTMREDRMLVSILHMGGPPE